MYTTASSGVTITAILCSDLDLFGQIKTLEIGVYSRDVKHTGTFNRNFRCLGAILWLYLNTSSTVSLFSDYISAMDIF